MDRDKLRELLEDVAAGRLPSADAFERLRRLPYDDLGFAKVDLHRALRAGGAEAVFCPGKTAEQVVAILRALVREHVNVLATRADADVRSLVEIVLSRVHEHMASAEQHDDITIVAVRPSVSAERAHADEEQAISFAII